MIDRLLIANRGEIAVRVARGARDLGISPVGVYSDADEHALFRSVMDDSVRIGAAPAAESYLAGIASSRRRERSAPTPSIRATGFCPNARTSRRPSSTPG